MVAFLRWLRSIVAGTFNGLVKIAFAIILILLAFVVVGLLQGDGLPGNMVLTLDLRQSIADSAPRTPFDLGDRKPTVMSIVRGLDQAQRDARVKGVMMNLGGGLSVAEAEEITAALRRFRAAGKFVVAYSHGFTSSGLGDYLTATGADKIWMQPMSPFSPSGVGAGEVFFRGLLDKVQAEPQIIKRAEFKSAADTFMEKSMTEPDRLQLTTLLNSVYHSATRAAAGERKVPLEKLVATLDNGPQFAGDAKKAGLIDNLGYDDEARAAVLKRAGKDAKEISLMKFLRAKEASGEFGSGTRIALIEAAGDIVDGTAEPGFFGGNPVIASDNLSDAIRDAGNDSRIKSHCAAGGFAWWIGHRVRPDSARDQKCAGEGQAGGCQHGRGSRPPAAITSPPARKKIVAEPSTITGSIGVLTGKVSFAKSLGLIGVGAEQVGVGKNALIDSPLAPFSDDQLALINSQVDRIYADFLQKVATGRNLPLHKVEEIAKGRIWSGTDAKTIGLVDKIGGLWTAVDEARTLAKVPANEAVVLQRYPSPKGFFESLENLFGGTAAGVRAAQGLARIIELPPIRTALEAMSGVPRGQVELRAPQVQAP
jgi:protease-4